MLGFLPLLFSYCEYNVRSIQSRGVLRVVTCCLVIRTAVTILLGISVATVRVVAVRLRLIYMLEHNRCGGDHPRLEGGELQPSGQERIPAVLFFVDQLTATKINPGRSTLPGLLQVVASACRLL